MDRLHPSLEFFLGNNDDCPATLPRDMKRRAAVPNLIHVSGEPVAEIGIGRVTWSGFWPGFRLEFRCGLLPDRGLDRALAHGGYRRGFYVQIYVREPPVNPERNVQNTAWWRRTM